MNGNAWMSKLQTKNAAPDVFLSSRVATNLEQARSNVLRTVNSTMGIAYWLKVETTGKT
jgi:hypothetical protein